MLISSEMDISSIFYSVFGTVTRQIAPFSLPISVISWVMQFA